MDADGSNINNVTSVTDDSSDRNPVWSPDGTKIAFDSDRIAGAEQVMVMDADGSNIEQVTHVNPQENLEAGYPDWQPIVAPETTTTTEAPTTTLSVTSTTLVPSQAQPAVATQATPTFTG